MRFILDENLPPAFAHALHALCSREGHSVAHIRDLCGANTTDVEWISETARHGGGVVVSGDRRMLTREHELRALRDHRLTTFILAPGWAGLDFWGKAWLLARWWPKLIEIAQAAEPGSIFRVPHRQSPVGLRRHR